MARVPFIGLNSPSGKIVVAINKASDYNEIKKSKCGEKWKEMVTMIIVIGIVYILYQVIKAAYEDSYVKDAARRNGMDWYASSTGIRDIRTNKKVFLNSDGTKKFFE